MEMGRTQFFGTCNLLMHFRCSILLFFESATMVFLDYKKERILYYRCFGKGYINENHPLFDRRRMQSYSEVSLPKKQHSKTI